MAREEVLQEATRQCEAAYFKRTPKSRMALDAAAKVLPGGDSRTATFFYPYPLLDARGDTVPFPDTAAWRRPTQCGTSRSRVRGGGFPAASSSSAARGLRLGAFRGDPAIRSCAGCA